MYSVAVRTAGPFTGHHNGIVGGTPTVGADAQQQRAVELHRVQLASVEPQIGCGIGLPIERRGDRLDIGAQHVRDLDAFARRVVRALGGVRRRRRLTGGRGAASAGSPGWNFIGLRGPKFPAGELHERGCPGGTGRPRNFPAMRFALWRPRGRARFRQAGTSPRAPSGVAYAPRSGTGLGASVRSGISTAWAPRPVSAASPAAPGRRTNLFERRERLMGQLTASAAAVSTSAHSSPRSSAAHSGATTASRSAVRTTSPPAKPSIARSSSADASGVVTAGSSASTVFASAGPRSRAGFVATSPSAIANANTCPTMVRHRYAVSRAPRCSTNRSGASTSGAVIPLIGRSRLPAGDVGQGHRRGYRVAGSGHGRAVPPPVPPPLRAVGASRCTPENTTGTKKPRISGA